MYKHPDINESFICKIWEGGARYYSDLKTVTGDKVIVNDFGVRNFDSGPDYSNAFVTIGDKKLQGDIEIHRDFNSWKMHKHTKDRNYNSVILQVVLWNEGIGNIPIVKRKREVHTVILSEFLTIPISEIWREIISNPRLKFKIPCSEHIDLISSETIKTFLGRLSLDRLNLKVNRMKERIEELIFEENGNTKTESFVSKNKYWNQIFYEFLFEALGYSKNKEPMLKLSRNLKLEYLSKVVDSSKQLIKIQSLLFGFSGFLNEVRSKSGYEAELKTLWLSSTIQKSKIGTMNKSEWKFFRLRPPNFPTIRLAYGAQIISRILLSDLFKEIILSFSDSVFNLRKTEKSLFNLLRPAEDSYWSHNYRFGKSTSKKMVLLGKNRMDELITNVIVPFVYFYAKMFEKDSVKSNVIEFYTGHKINSANSISKAIRNELLFPKGISINTSAIEQAAIQLYNFYCSRGKCDQCKIGTSFVRESGYEYRIVFY